MMHRRGYTLIDVLVAIVLLTLVLAMASRVFVQTMRAVRDARHYEVDVAVIEHALRLMRSDVWAATTIEVPTRETMELPGVSWTASYAEDDSGRAVTVLRRDDRVFELPAAVSFSRDGEVVLVEVDDSIVPMASARIITEPSS